MTSLNNSVPEPEYFSSQVSDSRRFYRKLDINRTGALKVVAGGLEKTVPDYSIARKTFPYFGIEFIIAGKGTLTLGDTVHPLSRAALFTYSPEINHTISSDSENPLVKYFINITGNEAEELMQRYISAKSAVYHIAAPESILLTLEELIRTGMLDTPYTDDLCTSLARILIMKIAESALKGDSFSGKSYSTYLRCRKTIEAEYLRLFTLADTAKICNVDEAYLCRLFKKFDYSTPYQYLLKLKMNHAAEFLHKPSVSVAEAAEETGYSDQFHFSRLFKSVFGISPGAFSRLFSKT